MVKKFSIESRRYTGSKTKLLDWIYNLIEQDTRGSSFIDIFAGTGVVSSKAMQKFNNVILNDFLFSNFVIYQGYFARGKWSSKRVENIIKTYNSLNPDKIGENYFSDNFGNKYFEHNVSKLIGHIREDIEKRKSSFSKKEYYILLSSLLYSADRVANTVGHYDAYIKKGIARKKFEMGVIIPSETNTLISIYREDSNELAKKISGDVVYIDPPYNSRQYSRFYHVLENLVKWEKPKLFGTALKPEPENISGYSKTEAPKLMEDLVRSLNCKYLVVSYNNTYHSKSGSSRNKISYEQLKNILNEIGKTKVYSKAYRFFNAGKTDFNNHREYIFITKKYR